MRFFLGVGLKNSEIILTSQMQQICSNNITTDALLQCCVRPINIDLLKTLHHFSQTAFRYHQLYEYLPFKALLNLLHIHRESKQHTIVAMKT